jgi:hypothetical protein
MATVSQLRRLPPIAPAPKRMAARLSRRRLVVASYFGVFAVLVVLAIGSVIGMNLAIDRSGFYPSEEWNTQATLDKKFRALRPATVVVGSSRISKFPLDGEAWGDAPEPRMLFPMSGAQFSDIVDALERHGGFEHMKVLVVGMDFFAFNALREYDEIIHPYSARQEIRRFLRFTVPLQTLRDRVRNTLAVLVYQFKKLSAVAAGRGEELRPQAETRGPTDYREAFTVSTRRFWINYVGNKYGAYRLDYPWLGNSPAIAALDRLLAAAERHKTRLYLFLHPTHVWDMEIIARLDLWPAYEEWMRRLAQRVGQADPNLVALWDFGGYNCVTTEPVPDHGLMRWHDDVGHYNQDLLGRIMLARMTERTPPSLGVEPGICDGRTLGQRLTPATVEASIATMRASRQAYVASRPNEAAILDRITRERALHHMPRRLW